MKTNKKSKIIGIVVIISALSFLLMSYQSKLHRGNSNISKAGIMQVWADSYTYQHDGVYNYENGKLYVSFQYVTDEPDSDIVNNDLNRFNQEFLTTKLTETDLESSRLTYNFEDVSLKLTDKYVLLQSKDFKKTFKRNPDNPLRLIDDAKIEYQLILETP